MDPIVKRLFSRTSYKNYFTNNWQPCSQNDSIPNKPELNTHQTTSLNNPQASKTNNKVPTIGINIESSTMKNKNSTTQSNNTDTEGEDMLYYVNHTSSPLEPPRFSINQSRPNEHKPASSSVQPVHSECHLYNGSVIPGCSENEDPDALVFPNS